MIKEETIQLPAEFYATIVQSVRDAAQARGDKILYMAQFLWDAMLQHHEPWQSDWWSYDHMVKALVYGRQNSPEEVIDKDGVVVPNPVSYGTQWVTSGGWSDSQRQELAAVMLDVHRRGRHLPRRVRPGEVLRPTERTRQIRVGFGGSIEFDGRRKTVTLRNIEDEEHDAVKALFKALKQYKVKRDSDPVA